MIAADTVSRTRCEGREHETTERRRKEERIEGTIRCMFRLHYSGAEAQRLRG